MVYPVNNLIPGNALVKMRRAFLRTLPDLCTVYRQAGQRTIGPYPSRLVAGTGDEEIWLDRLGTRKGWTVYLPFQLVWARAVFTVGTVVLPVVQYTGLAYKVTASSGGVPSAEPAWPVDLGGIVSDGQHTFLAVSLDTPLDLLSTDRLAVRGHNLEILDVTADQTWPVNIAAISAERV